MGTPKEVVFLSRDSSHFSPFRDFFQEILHKEFHLNCSLSNGPFPLEKSMEPSLLLWELRDEDRNDTEWKKSLLGFRLSANGKGIPLIVLAGLQWKDFLNDHPHCCNSYVLMPKTFVQNSEQMGSLLRFWIQWNVSVPGDAE